MTGNLRFVRRRGRRWSGCWAQSGDGRRKIVCRGGATSGCGGAQVSPKAQWATKLIVVWIDSLGRWRYSQAQIPDLVANTIPRFRLRAQSLGSGLAHVRRFPARTIEISASWFSGAEARADFGDVARGLKPPSPSGLGSCAGAKEAAEKLGNSCRIGEKRPSAAKAGDFFVALTARLKSCPFKTFAGSRVFPLSVKPRGISIAFTAPFDFAQGRLLKSCPFKTFAGSRVFPLSVKPRGISIAFTAPFDFAQGRLLKPCPFKTFAGSRVFPLSVKPRGISIAFTAPFDFAQGRLLKSCPDTFGSRNRVFPQPVRSRPDTARSFPAVYSSMPVSAASSRSRFTSTQQCRTGGRRFL